MTDKASQDLYARRGGNIATSISQQLPNAGFVLFILNEDGTVHELYQSRKCCRRRRRVAQAPRESSTSPEPPKLGN